MLYRALETVKAGCFCLRKLCTALGKRSEKQGKNFLCIAQKKWNQAEYLEVISWITGSMENPCINHLNCSGVMERSSSELRGHEKRPHSTRL